MTQFRLSSIEICDFCGFPGESMPAIMLNGKSLLLYGENGSGKSSIFQALRHLLDLDATMPFNSDLDDVRCLKHRFTDRDLQLGRVTLRFTSPPDAEPPQEMSWSIDAERPTSHPLFTGMARMSSFLDYRALLRTHFLHRDHDAINLFPLIVEDLLRHVEFPSESETFAIEWQTIRNETEDWLALASKDVSDMDDAEKIRYGLGTEGDEEDIEEDSEIDEAEAFQAHVSVEHDALDKRVMEFNEALSQRIGEIQDTANHYLARFDAGLEITFDFARKVASPELGIEPEQQRPELLLQAQYRTEVLAHPGMVLNEARLTAIAIAFYLAALKVEVPESVSTDTREPPLLVLDDILIGLDMSNRLPLLRILRDEFAAWQIILMTFDRHWFEVARRELGDEWIKAELFEGEDQQGHPKPVLITPSQTDYERAKAYFCKRDFPACANYLRKVCESELIRFLPEKRRRRPEANGEIGYIRMLGELYDCLMKYLRERGYDPSPLELLPGIKDALLNPLSHADVSTPVYRGELEAAIAFADRLRELQNVVVAETGTELVASKSDNDGHTWEYRVRIKPWESLCWLSAVGSEWFERCEARPVKLKKDGAVHSPLREHEDSIHNLYDRYCDFTKVQKATPYEDFRLPDGTSLDAKRGQLTASV